MQAAIKISKRAFLFSCFVLFAIMMLAGTLTRIIPAGSYTVARQGGREAIVADSFHLIKQPAYPVWRWFTAPLEVLFSPGSLILIIIILFITIISGAITILQNTGVMPFLIQRLVARFRAKRRVLIAVMVAAFMSFGALMGIFEEVVLLVPIAISIALSLGWDRLTGLSISILAVGFGFSAAISNPFSIGVAQQIAGLPLFSGALYRIIIFLITYGILLFFLIRYTSRLEKQGSGGTESPEIPNQTIPVAQGTASPYMERGYKVFLLSLILIVLYILAASFIPGLADYSLPVIALIFLISGFLTGRAANHTWSQVFSYFTKGLLAVLPGVILILMAASVKHIISSGQVLHTILYYAVQTIKNLNIFFSVGLVYLLVFILNLFIGSASAKALLVMPVIAPLADLIGFTRQTAVLAFCFGDGFSNLFYPTNAVLLLSLGISGVSYGSWFKFIIKLQIVMFILSLIFIFLATAFKYGPF